MGFDPLLGVDTPENVVLQYPLAGIGSRSMAYLVDLAIRAAAVAAVAIFLSLTASWSYLSELSGIATGAMLIFFFLIQNVYFIGYEVARNGQTPGKKAVGIRVVQVDGLPVTPFDSAVRNFVRLVDFLPGFYALGLICIFASSRCQRLGDLAAGTLVVKDRTVSLEELDRGDDIIDAVTGRRLPTWGDDFGARPRELIGSFVERRRGLRPEVRLRLARKVWDGLQPTLADRPEILEQLRAAVGPAATRESWLLHLDRLLREPKA